MIDLANSLSQAANAYRSASQEIDLTQISQFLEKISKEKKKQFSKIKEKSSSSGEDTKVSVSNPSSAYDRYMDATEKLLIDCLRYEEEIIRAYQKAVISGKLSKKEKKLYLRQLNESLVTYNQLKMLKDSRHYGSVKAAKKENSSE